MSKQKTQKIGTFTSLMVMLMAFGTFATATALVTKNQFSLAPTSLADNEDDNGGDSEDDEDNDEDDNDESSSKSEKEKEKKSEEAKKRSERAREDAKKQFERSHKSVNDDTSDEEDDNEEGEDADDDGDLEDDANEVEGDDDALHGMFKDRTKTISKLNKDILEAEKEILEKQAEGVDVTAALARLALAKAAIGSVEGAFDASNLEEAKRLAKETKKLTYFAREDDLHDAKKIAEDAVKVVKRIAQIKKKLVELKSLGGETSSFETMLAEVERMLAANEALITNGGTDALSGFAGLEAAERRAKTIKSAIENAIFALGGEDDELGDDHRSEVADFVKSLNDVADIEEGGIGKQVRTVARAQKLSSDKVASLLDDAKSRSDLAKLLIGPKKDALDGIQDEIVANNVRVEILNRALAQVTDEDIKAILSEQISTLQQETTQLQSFVGSQLNRSSLLSWLSALLPKF